jgi:uncharacterized protein
MKNLFDEINQNFLKKFKEKDQIAIDTLRMIKSSIKNKEIESGKSLKNEDIIKILRSEIKSRNESVSKFKQAGRDDLSQREEKEIELIKSFLPKGLEPGELKKIVEEAIKESKAESKADLGKVMPLAIKNVGGKASGEEIKDLVLKLLK